MATDETTSIHAHRELVTMHFMADEYIAGVLENSRRLNSKLCRFKGWRVRFESCRAGGGWLGYCGSLDAKVRAVAAARRYRKFPDWYRNVRVMRVYRKAKADAASK